MRRFAFVLVLACLFAGCGREPPPAAPPPPVGTVVNAAADDEAAEVVEFAGDVGEIDVGFRLAAGTELYLGAKSRLVLRFSDGSELVAEGPGRVGLRKLLPTAVTIDVGPGGIYRATSIEMVVGLHIEADTAALLQGATVLLDANPDWPIAELLEGAGATAILGGTKTEDMKIGKAVPLKPTR